MQYHSILEGAIYLALDLVHFVALSAIGHHYVRFIEGGMDVVCTCLGKSMDGTPYKDGGRLSEVSLVFVHECMVDACFGGPLDLLVVVCLVVIDSTDPNGHCSRGGSHILYDQFVQSGLAGGAIFYHCEVKSDELGEPWSLGQLPYALLCLLNDIVTTSELRP